MILISLHDKGQITCRGASVRSIRAIEVYRSEGDTVSVTVDPTDWLEGEVLSSITKDGASQTLASGKATFQLSAADQAEYEIAANSASGRKRSFVIRFKTDTIAPEQY